MKSLTGCPLEVTRIILSRYSMLAFKLVHFPRCITSDYSVWNIIVIVSILSDGVIGVIHIFRHKYSLIVRRVMCCFT